MFGDLPPSSSVIRFSDSAEPRMICLPVEVSPVNAILSMPGWSTIIWPTDAPGPVITLSTPAGTPASTAASARASAVSGVWLAGLMITVLPQARAGATFHAVSSSGKFHGTMAATTPTGSRSV